jgi:hypothetical protein
MLQWRRCLPCSKSIFSIAVKLFSTVLETNLYTVKGAWPVGKLMLKANRKQLICCSYLVAIIFTTLCEPPSEVEQLVHAIILYIVL